LVILIILRRLRVNSRQSEIKQAAYYRHIKANAAGRQGRGRRCLRPRLRPRPRPRVFDAKAKARDYCRRGRDPCTGRLQSGDETAAEWLGHKSQ